MCFSKQSTQVSHLFFFSAFTLSQIHLFFLSNSSKNQRKGKMVDLDWKAKMVSSDMSCTSPKFSNKSRGSLPSPLRFAVSDLSPAPSSACLAYEQFVRLPELSKLWTFNEFPGWKNESILKPALQALEITFRFISVVLSDPRPYVNQREWRRRLESLATHQIDIIAILCEDDVEAAETRGTAPIADLNSSNGVLARNRSSAVWNHPGGTPVVSRTSEASLLPRLATWQKSEDIASKILFSIECEMRRCPFTLGLGEPNLAGKPNLEYDLICKPSDLHSLKKSPSDRRNLDNHENQTLFTTHQILESWIQVSRELLRRIEERIDGQEFGTAASDCWLLERIWKLLTEIEDLHLLMDPDDFLRLKNQLAIKASTESEAFCFRSKALIEITKSSKDLKQRVPAVLGVEVDPKGGPRVQEAAMKLFHGHRKGDFEKIHLVQAFQAIESSLKTFFFSYRQLIGVVMGSLEVKANRALIYADSSDTLSQIFLEHTYFPSLDAAKTFLEDFWHHELGIAGSNGPDRARTKQ
ncbi:PREDICTED: nematode resistance protein-like HSPRO2 [Nelumbo nucifera]|uniref:Nematode resistance protein-like HSPRO2 n=1 Tax=Nelumbo nucifera TaxID=4432 RepID=A0A1U8ABR0_NELNU|nr:PREDICTED: nematode resistance protein-like HSPRO2 [Nelumbo nucifera]